MTEQGSPWLVEPAWVADHLKSPDVVVLDASWHMPAENRNAFAEYKEAHVPGALFFDIDEHSDKSHPIPHMLADPVRFSLAMRKMGIGDGMRIVVYETGPMFSAPRAWWNFRVMGVKDVAVMNGGLSQWIAEGRETEAGPPPRRTERHFTSRRNAGLVRSIDDVASTIDDGRTMIVDARSPGRFAGAEDEPRPGLRAGHIPGSCNLFYRTLLDDAGRMQQPDQLRPILEEAGIMDASRPVTASCGSGVTACVVALAMAVAGRADCAVYDGSWTEWGGDHDRPIATGAAD